LVVLVPCVAAFGIRAEGLVTSPALLIVIPVLISVLFSHAISEFWKRRRSGGTVLFEDLMLWGWLRHRRFERLLARSEDFVGQSAGEGMSSQARAGELERLAGALEARDPRSHGHSRRVARHATAIARSLNMADEEIARIRTAAMLHDIGKIEVPWEILEKPDLLTDDEFAEIKKHSAAGARLVAGMGDPELTAIVRHHHERIDGSGYPDGLSRGQIPLGARIIAVADTFDTLTSACSYRQPSSHEEALEVLRQEAGTHLDPRVVRTFDSRYSSSRLVALTAALLGLGRQVGQSTINFGTGVSQAAAVGAAAAVIGAAPGIEKDFQKQNPDHPAILHQESGATVGQLASSGDDGVQGQPTTRPEPGSEAGDRKARSRKGESGRITSGHAPGKGGVGSSGEGGGNVRPGTSGPGNGATGDASGDEGVQGGGGAGAENSGGQGAGGGNSGGGDDNGQGDNGGNDGGSSGGSGNGNSSGGGSGNAGNTTSNPVKALTETVQKPVQQVTDQVTGAIPTLPGKDPVSQGVNNVVGGLKNTLGKLVGKP